MENPTNSINWPLAGEALAAVTGILPDGPITPEQGAEAEGIPAAIEQRAVELCKFGAFAKFVMPAKVNFQETFARLSALSDMEREALAGDLTSPELIDAWAETVDKGRAYLRAKWPVAIRQTPTGPEWLNPSQTAGGAARALLALVDDPLTIFDQMMRGSLTPSEVEALTTVYPLLTERIRAAVTMGLDMAGAEERTCPWRHELQLRMLLGLPPVGLVTFERDAAPKQPETAQIDIKFDSLKTRNQLVR